jgi:hypothetical protein
MRTPRLRRLMLPLAAAVALAIPAAVTLLRAQTMVCYVEWCVPKGSGESCVVKPVPCPPEAT